MCTVNSLVSIYSFNSVDEGGDDEEDEGGGGEEGEVELVPYYERGISGLTFSNCGRFIVGVGNDDFHNVGTSEMYFRIYLIFNSHNSPLLQLLQ